MGIITKAGRLFHSIRRIFQSAKNGIISLKRYIFYIENLSVNRTLVLLESQHGGTLDGNVWAVLKELATKEEYKHFSLYVSSKPANKRAFRRKLDAHGLSKVTVVTVETRQYYRLLATAGYLVNDNTFIRYFIKRKDQIYLNTWHGTPWKTLGKSSKSEYYSIGNAQKTFLDSDYILYPNEFTMHHMIEDYMVGSIGMFTPLLMGYPRNGVFFDSDARAVMRHKYKMEGTQVYCYLPTWRGTVAEKLDEEQEIRLQRYLDEIDKQLHDNQMIYVKLHPVSKARISLTSYQRIQPFPDEETYDFLNAADGLITDYSSVFFDFAVTGRKVILFPYDLEEYMADRGVYFPIEELPFVRVFDTKSLVEEMGRTEYVPDQEFLRRFCPNEGRDAAKKLCHHVFLGDKCGTEVNLPKKTKKNVLLYCGDLALNGVTVSMQNLLRQIDTTENNYFILIRSGEIKRNSFRLLDLPEGVSWLGVTDTNSVTISDTLRHRLYSIKKTARSFEKMLPMLQRLANHEYNRVGARATFDTVIHFNGYSEYIAILYSGFPCRKVIYCHSDMDSEVNTRIKIDKNILSYAHRTFDRVAVVTEDLIKVTEQFSESLENIGHSPYIQVVHNIIDAASIQKMSNRNVTFDEATECSVSYERLLEILESKATKLINIGRYSTEKGHFRLMQQFAKVLNEHPDCYLIILGSRGVLFEETKTECRRLNVGDHIILIHYMTNPYPLLRKCDAFVFSSFYEGFGLVLAEADILGVPCVSTNIVGTQKFLEKYGGRLVENSDEGVRQALLLGINKELPAHLTINYENYNRQAEEEFLKVSVKEMKG